MIIDYIQLENFLSHNDSRIAFENGINVIYGKNGAGKSSIIDAIRFALFGEKRGNSIAELIRNGARECSVTIGFRLNERYYEVFRSQKLGKSGNISDRKSWIKVDGMIAAETAEGVIKEIQSGLRIDKDIFLNSVFVRQGEMDALISEVQSKREELFSRIIGINVLNDNAKSLKAIMDEVKMEGAHYANLDERLEENSKAAGEFRLNLENYEKDLTTAREKEKEVSALLEDADRNRNEAIRRKSDYDNLKKRIVELNSSSRKFNDSIAHNERRLKEIAYFPEEKERIEKDPLFSKRDEITEFFSVRNDFNTLSLNCGNIEKNIKQYEEDAARLSATEADHKRYEESTKKSSELEAGIREKQKSKAMKGALEEDIEKEKSEMGRFQDIASSDAYNEIRDLDRNALSSMIADLEKELRRIEGDRREFKARIGNINGLREELRKNRDTLGENNKCPVCGTELDEQHLNEIHSSYGETDRKYVSEIEEIKGRITELGNSYSEVESRVSRLRSSDTDRFLKAKEEIARLRDSIRDKEGKLESLKGELEGLEQMENSYEQLRKDLEGLQEAERTYNTLLYSMKRVSIDDLRTQFNSLQGRMNDEKSMLLDLQEKIGFEPGDGDQARMAALSRKYDTIRNQETEYFRTANEIESAGRNLKEIEVELAEKEKSMAEMGNVEEALSSASEAYSRIHGEHSRIRTDIAALEERMANTNSNMEKLAEERKRLEGDQERKSRIMAAISKLEKLRSAFGRDGIQSLIRKDSSVSINNMARSYLSSFNFEFDDIRIDENFNIKVINNGAEEPLDSLSGGERISLAIAVRLAIAKYLTGRVSTVIMDEPTNFLDEDRRNSLKDIIRYSLADEGMVQQMIMITHHSELTSAADSSYEIVKNNGVSKITQG